MRTASSSVKSPRSRTQCAEQVGVDRAVRHLADVSAGVARTSARFAGASSPALTASSSNGADGLDEELVEVGVERQVDHQLDRVDTRAASASVGDGGVRRERARRGPASARSRAAAPRRRWPGRTSPWWAAATSCSRMSGSAQQRAAARRAAAARLGSPLRQRVEGQLGPERRHVPMPRGWVRPNMRPPAAAAASMQLEGTAAGRWRPMAIGTPVSTARSTSRSSRSARSSGGRRVLDELEDAGAQLAQDPDQPATSSQAASREATGRSSEVSWCIVREVVNPNAPARRASRSSARHRLRSSSVRRVGEGPLAHHVGPQRRVPDVGRVVDRLGQPIDRVQVLGEGLPGPVDPCGHRRPGDVLGPLEVADDEVRCSDEGRARVNPQWPMTTVVTPCQHEYVPERIPEHLGVHVGVAVDEAGRHDVALGVDLLAAPLADAADRGDDDRRGCRRRRGSGGMPVPSTTVPPRITTSCEELLGTSHLHRDSIDSGVAGRHVDEMARAPAGCCWCRHARAPRSAGCRAGRAPSRAED